jgi:hypothetical protein
MWFPPLYQIDSVRHETFQIDYFAVSLLDVEVSIGISDVAILLPCCELVSTVHENQMKGP